MDNKKEIIDNGKFVAFAYTVKDADSHEVLFEAKPEAPDVMIYGASQDVIPGLAATLKGLSAGDRFGVTLPPEVAFGERNEEYVQHVPVEAFMRDGKMAVKVEPGLVLDMMTNTGQIVSGYVKEVTPETVVMDFNHPFAGKTVEFEGEVIEVRDATEDELHPKHSCGCGGGCGHHHGEDGDGCGCGDECGCGDNCGCDNCK